MGWWSLAVLAACDVEEASPSTTDTGTPGVQLGDEACAFAGRRDLAMDEETDDGVSIGALVGRFEGVHLGEMSWAALGAMSGSSLSVTSTGEASLVTFTETDPYFSYECGDIVELGVALHVATDDGQLDEAWDGVLWVHGEDAAVLVKALDPVVGSFDPADHVSEGADQGPVWVKAQIDATGAHGDLFVGGDPHEESLGTQFDGSATAVGSFGPLATPAR